MRRAHSERKAAGSSPASSWLSAGLVSLSLLFAGHAAGADSEDLSGLLGKADSIKTSDPAQFTSILEALAGRSTELSATQRQFLRYLKGWKDAYDGRYEAALPQLNAIVDEPGDATIRFRARATAVNVLVLATRYEEAFAHLNQLLDILPTIPDKNAREQALGIAAYLYNQVGEYELGLSYANKIVEEDWAGRGSCGGAQLQMEAIYKGSRAKAANVNFQQAIDACVKLGESAYANAIRTYLARTYMDQGRYDEAIAFLLKHYDEAQQTQYRRLISEYNALLALAYRQVGNPEEMRKYALRAVESSVKDQYTEPVVHAYRLLYLLAKERGDSAAALAYHEKYAMADKGYLDDVSARQLAYERVKHETTAGKLQIEALNSENRLLQLQRENNRLYIVLLITILGFIAFWAYKTKRSQLYFKNLAEQDGLTGIANRPHFIELAEDILEANRRSQQQVCAVLCDLDHFKSINDKHGHAMGDYVLKQVVAACRSHLRPGDIFGRFGGEEFGILLPGCNLDTARELCERLRRAIAEVANLRDDLEWSVSASFGIATTDAFGYELRQLLAHADAALYQAKHAGRNRVVAYDAVDFAELSSAGPRTRPVRASRTI